MQKKLVLLTWLLAANPIFAAVHVNLQHDSLNKLQAYQLVSKQARPRSITHTVNANNFNVLKEINSTRLSNKMITRYQQLYQGIPVLGAQVMVSRYPKKVFGTSTADEVSGHLIKKIDLDIKPAFNAKQAIMLAKEAWFSVAVPSETDLEKAELQIRSGATDPLQLVYLVSFKTFDIAKREPSWPHLVVDAKTGAIINQWNKINHYKDTGPGGNEKTHEYWYGLDGLPSLEVVQQDTQCIMDDGKVRLVDLESAEDWQDNITTPYQYVCANNVEDLTNRAFSPRNDAWVFGHVVVDMYRNWYGLDALQTDSGDPAILVMRVHFGKAFDNAFWSGTSMNFGDGFMLYPLVSLDITGHEVTHGFTQQHADLEYHDQSGAINEAMSDMAGVTAQAYLLATSPVLYNKTNLTPDAIDWKIGESVVPVDLLDFFEVGALRMMNMPSNDHASADCMDKRLARKNGGICAVSYEEVVMLAHVIAGKDMDDMQSMIVHYASGIFNKAFYLLAKKLGIKTAYQLMLQANINYWTPETDFRSGACGVINAANDLTLDVNSVKAVFGKVGIDVSDCTV